MSSRFILSLTAAARPPPIEIALETDIVGVLGWHANSSFSIKYEEYLDEHDYNYMSCSFSTVGRNGIVYVQNYSLSSFWTYKSRPNIQSQQYARRTDQNDLKDSKIDQCIINQATLEYNTSSLEYHIIASMISLFAFHLFQIY